MSESVRMEIPWAMIEVSARGFTAILVLDDPLTVVEITPELRAKCEEWFERVLTDERRIAIRQSIPLSIGAVTTDCDHA